MAGFDDKRKFINPYNFVALSKKAPGRKSRSKGKLTGFIDSEIIVKSKLVIPDHGEKEPGATEEIGPYLPFYRINGTPIIPGSELRGCIRSVFETATNSCLSVVNTSKLSARVPDGRGGSKPKTFNNRVPDILYSHAPCDGEKSNSSRSGFCPACMLFGSIAKPAVPSRLRFCDAVPVDGTVTFDDKVYMQELSSPKITSMEFYLTNKNGGSSAALWNYDTPGAIARGRKFYFHSTIRSRKDAVPNKRQFNAEAAMKDSRFTFRIYFEDITETELKQLLWVIALGENDESSKQCHKLGSGRPKGFGSVKMVVTDVNIRKFEGGKYSVEPYEPVFTAEHFPDEKVIEDLLIMTKWGFITKGKTVDYPLAYTDATKEPVFTWFMANRQNGTYSYLLPELCGNVDALELPGYDKSRSFFGGAAPQRRGGAQGAQGTQGAAAAQQSGRCRQCGKPTAISPKTGKPFTYCQDCLRDIRNG